MKNWLMFLCLMLSVGIIIGCGSVSTETTSTTTTTIVASTVTITGTAAASAADLAKLGSSALAVETFAEKEARIQSLVSAGFDEQSVRALDLVPLAAGDVTVKLYSISSTGAESLVATGTITAGTFSLPDVTFDGNKLYLVRITKTSATAAKDLVLEFFIDTNPVASASDATKGTISNIAMTPQTTLLVKLIVFKVIEELDAGMIDRDTIYLIESIVIGQINSLIVNEGLNLSTVKDTSSSDYSSLKNAVNQTFANATIQKAIKAVKFKAGLMKGATDLATAKLIMKEIMTYITGSPTGIPADILNSFATAYFNGTTKKISDMTTAANNSAVKAGVPVTNLFTDDNIATEIKAMLDATYGARTSSVRANAPEYELKTGNPLVQAAFPASQFYGMSTATLKTVNFTVPQIILLMPVGENICRTAGAQFNPPKFCGQLGLFTGFANKFQIMHCELRVEPFEQWEGHDPSLGAPPVVSLLTSFLNVGNMVDETATGTITATLTYPTLTGTSSTVAYVEETGSFAKGVNALAVKPMEGGGPPPGFKNFSIRPWGALGQSIKLTSFQRGGTATVKVYKNGVLEDSRDVTIPSVDLTSAVIQFLTPKKDMFIDFMHAGTLSPLATNFESGTKPTFSWTFTSTNDATVSFGSLTSGYAIEIRRVGDSGMPDYSGNAIFSTWNNQEFITPATQNGTTSLTLTSTLSAGTYSIMGAVVGIDAGGWPVVSGPWRSTFFKVVNDITLIGVTTVCVTGEVTAPTTVSGTLKVGLFHMGFGTDFMSSTVAPTGEVVAPASGNLGGIFSMTINLATLEATGMGGYDTIAWDDVNGDNKINGASGERPYFPIKHLEYHGGALNAMDSNFTFLGAVNSSQNNTGYNIDMKSAFW